ncbi:hypothetical protein Goarm_002067, partial [Gossypium armourianum]|nr:hypothetical protein [Gossypium armourianum]
MVVQSPHSLQSSVPTPKNGTKRVQILVKENGSAVTDNVAGQRRASARLQAAKQKAEMELLAKRKLELLNEDVGRSTKKVNVDAEKLKPKLQPAQTVIQQLPEISSLPADPKINKKVAKMVERAAKIAEGLDGTNAPNVAEKSAHMKVKETIRLFNKHYLHFVQEEEKRCGAAKVDKKALKAKKKANRGNVSEADVKAKAKRPDLKAISKASIDVGHRFYSRAEMVAVGFHSHWLNGIDYMGQSYKKGEYEHYIFPLAVAIVLSGMYEDDLDNAEDVVYTGQGGHDLTGNKRQIRDQVLERGNLALKNCVDLGVTVRVVRGHECANSYSGKVYTYDGLYKVVHYWAEKGISGFTVFKYRLRRLEGQPTLTTSQVHFTYGRVPQCPSEIRGLVCEDISGGQEVVPIPATNLVDDPP